MNVLLIGATGATGQELLPRLLAAGHAVTALVRRPEAITTEDARLRLVVGDVRDAALVDRAVAGQDAVVCAFGPRSLRKDDLQETLMRNLVSAATKHGVKRIVNLAAWASGQTARYTPWWMRVVAWVVLGRVFADKVRGEQLLYASALDFVNVSPGRLVGGPARGGVKASPDGKGLENLMSRADLAEFMIGQLTSDAWVRKIPILGY
jgi:putative NADH-flavin reductase